MKSINEKIHNAAEELLTEGAWPTVNAIREKLGTGSNTTINNELKTWRLDFLKKIKTYKNNPDCPSILVEATNKVWSMACEKAELSFSEKEKKLEKREDLLKEKLKTLEEKNKENADLLQEEKSKNNKILSDLEQERKKQVEIYAQLEELKTQAATEKNKHKELIDFYKNQLKLMHEENKNELESIRLDSSKKEELAYMRLEGLRAHIYEQIENERRLFSEEKNNFLTTITKLESKNEALMKEVKFLFYENGIFKAENNTLKNKKSKFISNRKKNEL